MRTADVCRYSDFPIIQTATTTAAWITKIAPIHGASQLTKPNLSLATAYAPSIFSLLSKLRLHCRKYFALRMTVSRAEITIFFDRAKANPLFVSFFWAV